MSTAKPIDPVNAAIGRRIREARKAAGFPNPETFAVAIGVSVATVARWEMGITEMTPVKLARISRATRAPVDYLLTGKKKDKAA